MSLIEDKVSGAEATGYIVSQLIGTVVTVQWFRMYKNEVKPRS